MTKSFILYQEYEQNISLLSQSQKGDLLDAIFAHNNGEEISLDAVTKMAFSFIKTDLVRNNSKYKNMVERNRLNGSKGGRPKKPTSLNEKPKKPTGFFGNPNDNDNVNDNDNDNDINKKNITKKRSEEKKAKNELLEDFEEFWDYYEPVEGKNYETNEPMSVPKGSRKKALEAYQRVRKGFDKVSILEGCQKYLLDCKKRNVLSCQVVTFLNQEKFNDDYAPPIIKSN